MTSSTPVGRHGANDEQTRLALSLVEALGLEGAISACRANGWDGVLARLVGLRGTGHGFPSSGRNYRGRPG